MPGLFTDSRMDEIMGISSDAAPEEKVYFLMKNIAPDDRALFEEYVGKGDGVQGSYFPWRHEDVITY